MVGLALVLVRRVPAQVMLVAYLGVYLMTISLTALHWAHWIIPVLPALALLAAFGLEASVLRVFRAPAVQNGALILGTLAILAYPAYQVVMHDIREFTAEHAGPGALYGRLPTCPTGAPAQEWYAAPLEDAQFHVTEQFTLAQG
jgi:hypothetical protein